MFNELFSSLLSIRDFRDCPIQLQPLCVTTIIDFLPLFRAQRIVDVLGNLELEVDGNVRARASRHDGLGGWLPIIGHTRLFFLLPTGDNNLPETGIPGVSTISLSRGQFSFVVFVEVQIGFSGFGARTTLVVEPGANPLTRGINK